MRRAAVLLAAVITFTVSLLSTAAGDHHGGNLERGAPKDGIPAITEPTFDTDDYVNSFDLVIGVSINGDSRAYPVKVLTRHEVANDVVGGVPVAVTYCPLCGTGIVFESTVDGQVLTFKISGLLWNSDLVMYDTATDSYWSQVEGLAIEGPLHGKVLKVVDSRTITMDGWEAIHPDTKVLDRPFPGLIDYDRDPYVSFGENYYESENIWFGVENEDGQRQLHPKAKVVGVKLGGEAKAYSFALLEREVVLNDIVGGTPVVVTFFDGSAQVFERANRSFSYTAGREMTDGSGNTYDLITGTGAEGSLEQVASTPSFWFAWYAFNPDTELYLASEAPAGVGGDLSGILAVAGLATLAVLALAGVWWIFIRRTP